LAGTPECAMALESASEDGEYEILNV
jgi:hypothetical protein